MTNRTTARPATEAQQLDRNCPTWCDDPHRARIDRDHYSDAVHVPAVWQARPEVDSPSVAVYLTQREPGYAAVLSIAAAVESHLIPDQARQMIAAMADQLARLDAFAGAFDGDPKANACPSWCQVTREDHEAEAAQWEGGAIHWSRQLVGDGEDNAVRVGAFTNADGRMAASSPTIHLDQSEMSAAEARSLAFDLLTAAAWADIAEGQGSR